MTLDRQFPPEIVQLIVKESVSGLDLLSTQDGPTGSRFSTLRSFATVNSIWRAMSKRFLYKYVTLNSDEQAVQFLQACRANGNEDVKYWVRSLSVTTKLFGGRDLRVFKSADQIIDDLVDCATRVRVLSLKSNSIDLSQIAGLKNLRRLHLVGCTMTDSPPRRPGHDQFSFLQDPSYSLPFLVHLNCYNSKVFGDAFFSPRCLPRLRSLAYREPRDADETAQLWNRFDALAPQLVAIKLYSDDACSQLLPHTKSLSLLSLPSHVPFSHALRHLKSAPRLLHLDLTSSTETRYSLQDQLQNSRKVGLERVLLNTEDAEEEWEEVLQDVVDKLGVKGIQVEVGELGFMKAIERMDRILLE